jgi:hypothetical protein
VGKHSGLSGKVLNKTSKTISLLLSPAPEVAGAAPRLYRAEGCYYLLLQLIPKGSCCFSIY